jgi:hypothetical protein
MKIRKFRAGDMVVDTSDSEEDKAKAAGLAASNAEKKSSGFLGLGRLFQGNIDEKGSEAYNKYGAGYGRKIEAENDRLKAATLRDTAAPAETKPATPTAPAETKPAAASRSDDGSYDALEKKRFASPAPASKSDNSYADLEKKRLASPRSTVSPGVTRVTEDMPKTRPEKGAQVTTGDARVAEYANAFPSNRDEGVRAAKRGQGSAAAAKPPAATAKAPAATAKPAAPVETKIQRARLDVPNAAGPTPSANPMSKDPSQRYNAGDAFPVLTGEKKRAEEKMDKKQFRAEQNAQIIAREAARAKAKAAKEKEEMEKRSDSARETQSKSVTERFKDRFKAGGGAIRGYASGGAVSASRRGDGIAQRGKTRGKMC